MSDNDLIRRGVIKERMIARGWKHPDSTVTEFVEDDLPAADVKPVVRGEWIWEEASLGYRCSVCQIMFDYGKTYQMFDHGFANFCPNCGAEMRKEGKQ